MADKDDFIHDITDLNIARKKLEKRLKFEELVSEFSTTLIIPGDIQIELTNWLRKFVEFLGVDRGVVVEYLEDKKSARVMMQYTVPNAVIPPLKDIHITPDSEIEGFRKGKIIKAEKIPDDLPQTFRGGIIEKDKTKSIIMVPLSIGNKVIGSISFSSYKKEREWSDDVVKRIKLIGGIIANTFLRIRSQKALLDEMDRRQKLEERYTSIIKTATVGFWISDKDQNILVVNDEYCRMSGYSREELLSMKISDIDVTISPEKTIKVSHEIENIGATQHEVTHRKKDGSFMDLDVSSNLIETEGLLFSFMRDITELNQRRKEHEERLKFEEIISEFSAALLNIDPNEMIKELTKWLEVFVYFLKVDRGVVNEYLDDQRTVEVIIQYTEPEVDLKPLDNTYSIPEGEIEEFQKGLTIIAEKIPGDLPKMLRGGLIEKDNTKSVLIVPLSVSNRIIGSLTFASYRKERKWPDDLVRRIKLIGEIIANAILRLRSHETLIDEKDQRQMLEDKFSSIIKTANVGFMIADLNAQILDVNDYYCEMSGYSREELLGMTIYQLDVSHDPDKVDKEKNQLLQNGSYHQEHSHKKKDGTIIDVLVSANFLEREGYICSFIRDITELNQRRKEREERLKFEELISEFSSANIIINLDDINEELNHWIRRFVHFLKVDRCIINEYQDDKKTVKPLTSYTVPDVDIHPPEESLLIPDRIRSQFERGIIIRAEKIPEDLPPQFHGWMIEDHNTKSLVIVPLTAGNQILGNLTFANYRKERKWSDELVSRMKLMGEIVANAILRKRSHDALLAESKRRRRLEERYTTILKTAKVGFWISDPNQNILFVNDEYCRMSGYSREELLEMKVVDIDFSKDAAKVDNEGRDTILGVSSHIESKHIRKDGTVFDVELNANFLSNEELFFCFISDVTELNKSRREIEDRLKFEELVSECSTALINIKPDAIEHELGKWLKGFVELMDADRCAVNEYGDDQQILKNVMQYSVPEVNIPVPDARNTPEGEIIELEKGIIKVERIPEDLPQMFRGSFIEKSKAKSHIIVPLLTGNQIFGNLAFTNYRKERKWPDELVKRIKLIGEIVGNAILRKRSHEALLAEIDHRQLLEEKYASIIQTANVGFWISDLDSRILEVNDAYCTMSGYSREELIGMRIDQIDLSLNPEHRIPETKRVLEEGGLHIETSHTRKDGTTIEVAVNSSVREKEGIIFTFIRDITELNQVRRDLEDRLKFEKLNSQFSAALVNVKPDHINKELNHWVKKLVDFLEVDRGIFHEYDYDNQTINIVASYTDPDVDYVISPLLESHKAPDEIMKEFGKGIIVRAEKIPEDLPPLFQGGILERHNTKSIVIVPLSSGDQVIGNLTFVNYIKEHEWSDELIRKIKLVGEIVAHAILRIRSHTALLKEMERRQELEERYTSIIKTANVGFMIIDLTEHSIIEVNDEYCRMSGYSRDELISKHTWDIDASMDPDKVRKEGESLIKEGSFHLITSHIRKDGSLFDVEISSNLLGRDNIVYSFVRDITDLNQAHKELEERLKFEEYVSEFSAALINVKLDDISQEINRWLEIFSQLMVVDRFTISDYQNDFTRMSILFSYTNPDVKDKLRPLSPKQMTPFGFHKYLRKGDIIRYESLDDVFPEDMKYGMLELKKDGTKSLLMLPLRAGDVLLGTMSISSLTSEKKWTEEEIRRLKLVAEIFANALMRDRADSELESYRKNLEELVDERTAKLKEAQEELLLSEKMVTLGRLTATVSHELRNPLGTIRSSLFSVNKRLKGQDEKTEMALERAERSVQRCDIIIEELLDYSKAQSLTLRRTDIDNWLNELFEDEKPPEDIILEKELKAGVSIEMDRERLRRCIINILTNAYQSIEEKSDDSKPGRVRVMTEREESGVRIEISDNGIGFAQEDVGKILEPLYSTKTFGVGLGISITKQIVEMHGWSMDMMGEPGKGALVTIRIPIT